MDASTPHPLDTGDTVRLQIGGPLMTVLAAKDSGCCCIWFDGTRLEHGTFEFDAVELVERGVRLVPQDSSFRSPSRRAARSPSPAAPEPAMLV